MARWVAGIALAFVMGVFVGEKVGASSEREAIARDCKYGGSFALRRTGFACSKLTK